MAMSRSISTAIFCVVVMGAANAVSQPTLEANGNNLHLECAEGDLNIKTKACNVTGTDLCTMKSTVADMTALLDSRLNRIVQAEQTIAELTANLSAIATSLLITDNTDGDDSKLGLYTKFLLEKIYARPTKEETANDYLSKVDATKTYVSKPDFDRVADNQVHIQKDFLNFTQEIKAALRSLNDTVHLDDFPRCEPYPSINNGVVGDKFEHVPGTTVGFECNSMFQLKGSTEATCLVNGSWLLKGAPPSCITCDAMWVDVPCALNDFIELTGSASITPIDVRTGVPGTITTARLPNVTTGGQVFGARFSFQYVTGFGFGGVQEPYMYVYIVDAHNTASVHEIYNSQKAGVKLEGYDYDSCNSRGGWGDDNNPTDGCYSPRIPVSSESTTPIFRTDSVFVKFKWQNNRRALHINDDGMKMQLKLLQCPL